MQGDAEAVKRQVQVTIARLKQTPPWQRLQSFVKTEEDKYRTKAIRKVIQRQLLKEIDTIEGADSETNQ